MKNFLNASGSTISGKLQEEVQKLIDDLDIKLSPDGNKFDIRFEIELPLLDVLLIMKHNKKELRREFDSAIKYWMNASKTEMNEKSRKEIAKYEKIWELLNTLSDHQDDYFRRPSLFSKP